MAFVAPLIPYITAGATALSGLQAMQASQYQGAVARANAEAASETARRELTAANLDMQDKDLAARDQLDNMLAGMAASGLSTNSGSMLLRRTAGERLATQDRERLALKRDINFKNTKQQQASYADEASALNQSSGVNLLSSFLAVPTSYLSGASMVSNYNLGRMSLESPSYMR